MGGRGRSRKILLVLTFADVATLLRQNTLARHGKDLGYAWLLKTTFKRLYFQVLLRHRVSRFVVEVTVSSCCWRAIEVNFVRRDLRG